MGEVEAILGREQEVEQLGELVGLERAAGPRDQHVALGAGDVDVVGSARDRALDDLEHVEVGIREREATQLFDRAAAGELELPALREADVALACARDDLVDRDMQPIGNRILQWMEDAYLG